MHRCGEVLFLQKSTFKAVMVITVKAIIAVRVSAAILESVVVIQATIPEILQTVG